jgi:hypothetical protein
LQEKTLLTLTSPHINPSVTQSFLNTMLELSPNINMEWLSSWILHAERSCLEADDTGEMTQQLDALTSMIRCYTRYASLNNTTSRQEEIAYIYQKLTMPSTKLALLREFTKQAFGHNNMRDIRSLLSPLIATCVFGSKASSTGEHIQLPLLFLEGIWREAWTGMTRNVDEYPDRAMNSLSWLTQALDIYLLSSSSGSLEKRISCKEISSRWLIQLLEIATYLVQCLEGNGKELSLMSRWLTNVVSVTLPRLYHTVPTFRIPLESVLVQIQFIIQTLDISEAKFTLNSTATLRLATLVLINPIQEDVKELLTILTSSVKTLENGNQQLSVVPVILRGVASMFAQSETCKVASSRLMHALTVKRQISGNHKFRVRTKSSLNLPSALQLLDEITYDIDEVVQFFSQQNEASWQLSAAQQIGALLLGIGLLGKRKYSIESKLFLKKILSQYPHLGVLLLPIMVESIHLSSVKGDGETLLQTLNFMCDIIVQDAQCAREIWNLLGVDLIQEDIPATIRSSVIRLFPQICAANKRLYKRIMAALEKSLSSGEDEVQLAIAATIADLCKDDHIRDVTDVIPWIQGFIVDSGWVKSISTLDKHKSTLNAALVHYAILSLHHLVVADELDYAVVMVVLKKRLCNIHDMNELEKLPPLVLESLCLLLGDGETEDDSEDEDRNGPEEVRTSLQVRQSVQTLISLILSDRVNHKYSDGVANKIALISFRRNIYKSLTKYSIAMLGTDAEGMQAVCTAAMNPDAPSIPDSGARYNSIKRVIEEGINFIREQGDGLSLGDNEDGEALIESLVSLISKILLFEEETFGSSMWQKRGGKARKTKKKIAPGDSFIVRSSYVEALPSIETIQQIFKKNRSTATALSTLMCFEDKAISQLSDIVADIIHESSDPLILSLSIQAWLNATRSILLEVVATQSSSEGLDRILLEIRNWRFQLEDIDNMHLALSILALHIHDILGPYGNHSAYVDEICEDIWSAYREHEFENPDVAELCISFVGVSFLRSNNMPQLEEIVESLESSATGYGGKVTFGACFGLGVIAQAISNHLDITETDYSSGMAPDLGLTRRIISFLLNQLLSCIKGKYKPLSSLVTCVENGAISPEIIDALTLLKKTTLEVVETKRDIAKSIFISFALCLPALAVVNDELLLGMYCLLDCLPWGCGKGFALPNVLRTCRQRGLFESSEIEKIYSNYAKIFEEGMKGEMEGLDDIFYAVTATMTGVIPHSIRQFLVGNKELLDENGFCVSLLSNVTSLSYVPCLGHGTLRFTDAPRLSPGISKENLSSVSSLVIEAVRDSGHDASKYSQVANLLMGYMVSMKSTTHLSDISVAESKLSASDSSTKELRSISQLPVPQQGTVLGILMHVLTRHYYERSVEADQTSSFMISKLLCCLEVLSLPANFVGFFEYLLQGNNQMKAACTKLLVSQISGRPRAVFDGREYVDMAIQLIGSPSRVLREIFSELETPEFLVSFGAILPKFPSDKVEKTIADVWRLCVNEINHIPGWTISFLSAMKMVLSSESDKNRSSVSPKTLKIVQVFLLTKIFLAIRDVTWTTTSTFTERRVLEKYVMCLAEIPNDFLLDAEFFSLTDHDGFIGEALRYRCILGLVQVGYFTTPARAHSEIQSAMSWFSRQLVSSDKEVFSITLLNVCCSIAEAASSESASKRRDLVLMLLDNLLLVGSSSSTIGLQMLGALACQCCKGRGFDGDLSLAYLCSTNIGKWQDLSPLTLQQMFAICVHDLPFNLASYSQKEKMGNVIFNRLWRLYKKWQEQGADEVTLSIVRQALICCRSEDSVGDGFSSLTSSMLSQ